MIPIAIRIDAGKSRCEHCVGRDWEYFDDKPELTCNLFPTPNGATLIIDGQRVPACLKSESDLKRLVEAAKVGVALIEEINSWCWPKGANMAVGHRAKIVKMIDRSEAWPKLAEALKPFEEKQ